MPKDGYEPKNRKSEYKNANNLKQGKIGKDNFIIRAQEFYEKPFNRIKAKVSIEYLALLVQTALQES